MSRASFISDLVNMLVRLDKKMVELDEPVPQGVEVGIIKALVSLGEEAIPELHRTLLALQEQISFELLIDVLGQIGKPESATYIIAFHQKYSSFMSGAAAIQALRRIKTEEAYLYLANLISSYIAGKHDIVQSELEVTLACEALGEWADERALIPLRQAVYIENHNRMPEAAIRALAKYPKTHEFLRRLATEKPLLAELIEAFISTQPIQPHEYDNLVFFGMISENLPRLGAIRGYAEMALRLWPEPIPLEIQNNVSLQDFLRKISELTDKIEADIVTMRKQLIENK